MELNRMGPDDLGDFPGMIKAVESLGKAFTIFQQNIVLSNQRIAESMAATRKQLEDYKQAIISGSNAQMKAMAANGLAKQAQEVLQAYQQQKETLKQNETYLKLNAQAVTQLQTRLSQLVNEYNELERSGKGTQKRLNEIQREIRSSTQVLKSLTSVTEKATKANQAAERSYNALAKQTAEMKARLKNMSDAFDENTGKINKNNKAAADLQRQIEKNEKTLRTADSQMSSWSRNVGNYGSALGGFGKNVLGAAAGIIGISSAFDALKAGLGVIADFERIDAMLMAVSKDSTDFNNTQQMLLSTADRLGVQYESLAESYKGLKAASRGTALEGATTERVFQAIISRGAQLKLSSEQVEGALKAVEQMMSKGKVTAEELRQQLAERLPGSIKLFADALGVSEPKLNKMLEQGQVLASDALPKVAAQIEKTYGIDNQQRVEGMAANWNRLTNEAKLFIDALNDNGLISNFFGAIAGGIATVFADLRQLVSSGEWGAFVGYLTGDVGSAATAQAGRIGKEVQEADKQKFRLSDAPTRQKELDKINAEIAKRQKELDATLDKPVSNENTAQEQKLTKQIDNMKARVKEYEKINKELAEQEKINNQRAQDQKNEIEADGKKKKADEAKRKADQELQRKVGLSKTDTGVKLSQLSNDKQDGIISEEEYNKKRYDVTMDGIKARQKLLESAGKKETDDYKELTREKLDAETQYHRDSLKQQISSIGTKTNDDLEDLRTRFEDAKITEHRNTSTSGISSSKKGQRTG